MINNLPTETRITQYVAIFSFSPDLCDPENCSGKCPREKKETNSKLSPGQPNKCSLLYCVGYLNLFPNTKFLHFNLT